MIDKCDSVNIVFETKIIGARLNSSLLKDETIMKAYVTQCHFLTFGEGHLHMKI